MDAHGNNDRARLPDPARGGEESLSRDLSARLPHYPPFSGDYAYFTGSTHAPACARKPARRWRKVTLVKPRAGRKRVASAKALSFKARKPVPHEFVLEALHSLETRTRSMFGCLAVYCGEKILICLRDKPEQDHLDDNGVWLATSKEHHDSLKRDLPSMRDVQLLAGGAPTSWQNLPSESDRFEEDALRACELLLRGDPRIGKVPERRKKAKPQA